MPIFTMSNFSLPKSVCSKLNSFLESSFGVMDDQMGQKFQWKNGETYANQEVKVVYRSRNKEDDEFQQCFDCKIGKECLVRNLFSIPKANSSLCLWKHICDNRNIIKRASCELIGEWSLVNIWLDPWITHIERFIPFPKKKSTTISFWVSELFWRIKWLNLEKPQLFDADAITNTYKIWVPRLHQPDKWILVENKSRNFLFKETNAALG